MINQLLMMFILLCQIPNLVDGWAGLAHFLPVVQVIKCTRGNFFLQFHQVLIEIIVHHEDVTALLLACIKFLLVISLVSPESVHHQFLHNADLLA